MSDMMTFPDTWEEFEKSYGFTDNEEVYTNGARLIPSFRVKQWLDHLPSVHPQWVSCSEKMPEEKKEVLVSADGDLYIAILETINGKSFWSEVIEYRYIMGVDAWMPLPNPYKEEEDD